MMAIVRCIEHLPKGQKHEYVLSLEPVGYPETAAICGRSECEESGLVWLTEDERHAYLDGQRIFGVNTNAVDIRVK